MTRGHVGSSSEASCVKERLLLEAAERIASRVRGYRVALVVDAHLAGGDAMRLAGRLLGAGYARMGDRRVYRGIQLADLLAGACSERLLEPGGSCRG